VSDSVLEPFFLSTPLMVGFSYILSSFPYTYMLAVVVETLNIVLYLLYVK
jgi:hypothetical protein